jgi:hypothetical protein
MVILSRFYLKVTIEANNGGGSYCILCSSHVLDDDRQPLREFCREPKIERDGEKLERPMSSSGL